jgi:hypothetical protein
LRTAHYSFTNRYISKTSYFNCAEKIDDSRYSRGNIAEKKFEYLEEKKEFLFVEKTAIPEKIDIATIDTEIEILKIKIVYRQKLAILQNLRSEDANDKSEFYIFIGKEILSVFRKRAQSSSTDIFLF